MIGVVLATQGMIVVGLSGVIVALVGAYLIALGAWGIHRGALTAIAVITGLALLALLTCTGCASNCGATARTSRADWYPSTSCRGCATTGGPGWLFSVASSCSPS